MQTQLQTKLAGLRAKVKFIQGVSGLTRSILVGIGLVTATYLLDRSMHLPLMVRGVLLIVSLAVLIWVLRRTLIKPLHMPLHNLDLAAGVEALNPRLRDRLLSSLDFQQAMKKGELLESRTLAQAVVTETLEQIQPVDFTRVARSRRVIPVVLLCGLAICFLAGWFSLAEDHFRVWLKRCVLLSSTETWPRTTSLRVLMPPTGSPVYVTREDRYTVFNLPRGLDFTLNVTADRGDPAEVTLHFDPFPGDADSRAGGTRTLPRVQRCRYAMTFERLTRSFAFHVTGGDDDDRKPLYLVRVHLAPAVGEIQVRADYPEFTGWTPRTFPRGDVEVPQFTWLTISIEATQPLSEAWFCVGEENEENPVRKKLKGLDDTHFEVRFRAENDFDYTFDLTGRNRVRNHNRVRFRVTTLPDRAPTIRNLRPRATFVDITPKGVLPLLALVRDDYSARDCRLLVARGKVRKQVAFTGEDRIGRGDDGDIQASRAFFLFKHVEISDLKVAVTERRKERPPIAGDILRLTFEVEDNHKDPEGNDRPNTGRSKEIKLEVVRVSDMERRINDRQLRIKEDVRKLITYEQRALAEASDLLALLEKPGTGEKIASELKEIAEQILTVERRQNRLTSDLLMILTDLRGNLDAFVFNRLEDSPVVNRALDIFTRETRRKPDDEMVRFRSLVAAFHEGTLGKSDALDKLIRMTGLALEAAEEASPAAGRALGRARLGTTVATVLDPLKTAVQRQKKTLEILLALMEGLEDWEDYQEVIQLNKELIDLQKEIMSRTINLIQKKLRAR